MQSEEKSISSSPTRVLFIPKLPPLLANWDKLKTHFSQYGNVINVVLNPQRLSCTINFETVADAEYAKSEGCFWRNKEFPAIYCKDNQCLLDRRAATEEPPAYTEIEGLWSDEDVEMFGVDETSFEKKLKDPERKERVKRKHKGSVIEISDDEVSSNYERTHSKYSTSNSSKISDRESSTSETDPVTLKTKLSSGRKISLSPLSPAAGKPRRIIKRMSDEALKNVKKTSVRSRVIEKSVSSKEKALLYKELKKGIRSDIQAGKKKSLNALKLLNEGIDNKQSSDKPVLTLKEQFMLLEERDRVLRKSLTKSINVKTAKALVGTCPDMCPEKERIMREYRRLVSVYETVPGTQKMDHRIAVKAYVRSSADQEEPLPHDLRPESVLSMTMGYLITNIMQLVHDPDVNLSEWYDFCWDRLRGVRKDIIQQRLCSLETVKIIEQCARFHISCYDLLWGTDPSVFDEKINTENLMNCLQTLRHMYEDLGKENINCPNEAEFNAYMILLNMKTGDLMATYQQFSETLQKQEAIQNAVKLYLTFNNSMYSQFFKLVKNSTYLNTCLLQRYFYHMRFLALQAIAKAYCPPNKGGTIPLKQMKKMLKFDTAEDTKLFCEGHGILLKENRRDFSLYRNDFLIPETKITVTISSSLVVHKRLPIIDAVIGDGYYHLRSLLKSFKNHKIHSSFTDDGKLNESASDASDQQRKSRTMLIRTPDSETSELTETDEETSGYKTKMMLKDDEYKIRGRGEGDSYFMEVDEGENTLRVNKRDFAVGDFEETDFTVTKDSDKIDDSVSRLQNKALSTFKFDLKSVEKQQTESTEIQKDFQFMPVNTNLFGNLSSMSGDQSRFGSFNLKNKLPDKQDCTSHITDRKSSLFEQIKLPFNSEDNSRTKFSTFINDVNNVVDNRLPTPSKVSSPTRKMTAGFKFSLEKNSANNFLVRESSNTIATTANSSSNNSGTDSVSIKQNISDPIDVRHFSNNKEESCSSTIFTLDSDKYKSPFEIIDKTCKENADGNDKEEIYTGLNTVKEHEEKQYEIERKLQEDDRIMKVLKKDLRRRLKALTARHFIRKWKQKIEKLKLDREEFPLLVSVPIDQHELLWGTSVNIRTFSERSLLTRLNEKRRCYENVKLILSDNLSNESPKYVGNEVAENIALNNSLKLNLRDFNIPFYWKLVVSIPYLEEFFVNKFTDWLKKLFYKCGGELGSVVEVITSQNVSVHYCVNLVSGNNFKNKKDQLNGMSSLLFFNVVGVEDSSSKCQRFRNLLSSNKNSNPTTVSLVNIGKGFGDGDSNKQLLKDINRNMEHQKIMKWEETYFKSFESIIKIVKFLSSDISLSNDIRVSSLNSLFNRVAEHLVSVINCLELTSDEFTAAFVDPNFVIKYYNFFLEQMQELILKSDFKDYNIVPPEFKYLVQPYTRPGETSLNDSTFKKSHRSKINEAFSNIKLPRLKPWPPCDEIELLDILSSYCDSVDCRNILSRVIRLIDVNDEISILENLSKVSWVNVVDLIFRQLLDYYSNRNKNIIVICNESEVSSLFRTEYSLKLLYHNLDSC